MSKNLQAALSGLDPANDNHWTADGLPRLETVRLLSGDATVTREAVTAALPGLTRGTVGTVGAAQPAGQGGSTPEPAGVAPAPVQGASQGSGSNGEDVQGLGGSGTADDETEPKGDAGEETLFEQASQEVAAAMAARDQATIRLRAAQTALDRILEARDASGRGKAVAAAATVQDYLTRQRENAEERRRRAEALKGVPLADILPVRAAIDVAFARKTARGLHRPQNVTR